MWEANQIEEHKNEDSLFGNWVFSSGKPTWSELFNASVVVGGVDREEVFEPGDVWVRVAAGSAKHGGGACSLHHFQLWAHVYSGETRGQLVLCKQVRDRMADVRVGTFEVLIKPCETLMEKSAKWETLEQQKQLSTTDFR